jgi:uncharacterized membrane-anchored protein
MKRPITIWFLSALLIFLSIGALYGGWMLLSDPSGASLQLPLSYIQTSTSPFNDYLIPGIILFTFNGLLSLFAVYAAFAKPKIDFFEKANFLKGYHWAWTLLGVMGFGILTWILVEIFMTQIFFAPLQVPFIIIGLAIIGLALLPQSRNYFRIK